MQDIRHLVAKNRGSLGDMGLEPTDYIFPPNGHGALDNDENLKYQDRLVHPIDSKIPSMTIDIAVSAKARGMMEQIFKGGYFHYNLVISPAVRNYSSSSPSDNTVPHLNYANQDIMFEEDISLLSYSFAFSDIFALKAADAESWLRQFKNELDGKTRMTMLRKLHFDSLVTQPAVIPLYTSRMGAMARNGWKMKFPSYTADTLFWYLEKG